MSTTQLQLRRGNSSAVAVFCGAEGELIYDTTNKHLRVHDGHKNAQDEFDHTGTIIPNRDEVVRKTGNANETITGVKTFTHEPVFTNGNLNIKHTNVTKGTAPSSNQYWGVEATAQPADPSDTTWQGRRLGKLEWCLTTDNVTTVTLSAYKNEAASSANSMIKLEYDAANNTAIATAPTPAADNSTSYNRIVTTGWANNPNNGTTYYNNLVHITGTETISGTKTFTNKLYANGGVQGTASSALWADLAEQYLPDEKYPIGTLIKFGGKKDITIADNECNGIISERPGFLLDCGLEDSLPVALVGKTRVRVVGKVNKFDKLVLSEIPGIARVRKKDSEKVIGIALDGSDNKEEKLVMSVVKIEF